MGGKREREEEGEVGSGMGEGGEEGRGREGRERRGKDRKGGKSEGGKGEGWKEGKGRLEEERGNLVLHRRKKGLCSKWYCIYLVPFLQQLQAVYHHPGN